MTLPIPDIITGIENDLADLRGLLAAKEPRELYDPIQYVLDGGGKRLRPTLVHLAGSAFGAPRSVLAPLATAVEVFHNFTLVHDDIMDNASTRRGRATVHEKWSTSTAILVGDAMLGISYDLIGRAPADLLPDLSAAFNRMVAALCEGQTNDMHFESRSDVSIDEYIEMIDGKTGALLECCLQFGGIAGGASLDMIDSLGSAGRELGRAFQIQDDLLDLTATDVKWGKVVGGDLIEAKKAYLLLRALQSDDVETREWFGDVAKSGLRPNLVQEARSRLADAGILDDTAAVVEEHSSRAIELLSVLPGGAPASALVGYVRSLAERRF